VVAAQDLLEETCGAGHQAGRIIGEKNGTHLSLGEPALLGELLMQRCCATDDEIADCGFRIAD
jgi:hypothetical protein